MAHIEKVEKNSSDSHQTSPGYVLTFLRYEYRDTFMYGDIDNSSEGLDTRKEFVVVNDAIQVKVSNNKSNPVPSFSCVLKQGDINYLTAVHPGDYVTVNMVDFKEKAMKIRDRALASQAINKVGDGFKGVFKVQDVRMYLQADPRTGVKEYYVQITGKGFDEFNNILYFNPALVEDAQKNSADFLFLNNFSNWEDLIKARESNNVQDLLKAVILRTIGEEMQIREKSETRLNQIFQYAVPKKLGALLNKPSAKYISQINNYYLGTWASSVSSSNIDGFSRFFLPDEKTPGGNFYRTNISLEGTRAIDMQDFQYVSVWSLLQDYGNVDLNDMYTCYRVDPTGKYVYPSFVARQKPFNTNHYEQFTQRAGEVQNLYTIPHTKFLDVPRWYIDPDLITSLNIGRSDAGRINFVQVYTRSLSIDGNFDQADQITLGNYVEDKKDIIRNGRKPYVKSINYDFAGATTEYRAKKWAYLVADWLFNGHLKMNGTIESVGIEKPICIGDNLELDNTVYHIESIDHVMSVSADGLNTFRTQLQLSMGVNKNSSNTIPVYAEMDHTDSLTRRRQDQKDGTKILPGFSDTQDLPSRSKGEEVTETKQKSFTNPKKNNKGKK